MSIQLFASNCLRGSVAINTWYIRVFSVGAVIEYCGLQTKHMNRGRYNLFLIRMASLHNLHQINLNDKAGIPLGEFVI